MLPRVLVRRLCDIALAIALLAGTLAIAAPARAQELPPRPAPVVTTESNRDRVPATGRITGTVIDRATGAPAPGVTVTVGAVALTTDENGNYGLDGLVAGRYGVSVTAPEGESTTVMLDEAATVVQHLSFGVAPQPSPPPAAVSAPPVPTRLPVTGGETEVWPLALAALELMGAGLRLRSC